VPAKVGGLEIAGLVGVLLAAAAHRVPALLDGFIIGAAAKILKEMTTFDEAEVTDIKRSSR